MDQKKLKASMEALKAVKHLLRSTALSINTHCHLHHLKGILDAEIAEMAPESDGDGDGDGVAAD